MKIKGKEIKEYANKATGLVTCQTLLGIEKDLEESLDNIVLNLQTYAYNMEKRRHPKNSLSNEMQTEYYFRARSYLNAIGEINRIFSTNYSTDIEKVTKYFEAKRPAKDD